MDFNTYVVANSIARNKLKKDLSFFDDDDFVQGSAIKQQLDAPNIRQTVGAGSTVFQQVSADNLVQNILGGSVVYNQPVIIKRGEIDKLARKAIKIQAIATSSILTFKYVIITKIISPSTGQYIDLKTYGVTSQALLGKKVTHLAKARKDNSLFQKADGSGWLGFVEVGKQVASRAKRATSGSPNKAYQSYQPFPWMEVYDLDNIGILRKDKETSFTGDVLNVMATPSPKTPQSRAGPSRGAVPTPGTPSFNSFGQRGTTPTTGTPRPAPSLQLLPSGTPTVPKSRPIKRTPKKGSRRKKRKKKKD